LSFKFFNENLISYYSANRELLVMMGKPNRLSPAQR